MNRIVVIAVPAVAVAIGWLLWQQNRLEPFVVSGLVEADQIRVGSRVGGRVESVKIVEGQAVEPATTLLEIAPYDLRAQLAEAEAALAARQAEAKRLTGGYRQEEIEQARARRDQVSATLSKLEAGPRPEEIEIARQMARVAEANLSLATSEHQRVAALLKENRAAQTEFDKAVRELGVAEANHKAAAEEISLLEQGTREEEIAEARARLAEAEGALSLLKAGFRAEEIEQANAQVAAAQAQVSAIQVRLAELTVVSPCACTVEAVDLRPGDLVAPGAPTVTLLDLSRLWVRAFVPEARLGEIRLGQHVWVSVDSFPKERFDAEITFIAREAEFTPRNVQTPEERSKQVFRIKATLTSGLDRLRPGMAGDVHFEEETGT